MTPPASTVTGHKLTIKSTEYQLRMETDKVVKKQHMELGIFFSLSQFSLPYQERIGSMLCGFNGPCGSRVPFSSGIL